MDKVKNYLKLIRAKHWVKNFLIFLPLFFNGDITKLSKIKFAIIGFIIFSLISSVVYIINDIEDIEKDKKHPVKKNRPLAAGTISIKKAYTVIGIFLLLVILLNVIFYKKNYFSILLPFFYLAINILYSRGLKNIPIVDVTILTFGFVIRVMYGGVITSIEVSKYLYLMIMFGSFYLGFGKRRNEIKKNTDNTRKVLKFYNKDFLDKNMYVSLTLAITSYTLWTVDKKTITNIGNDYLFWTIPVVMIIFATYSLNIEGNSHGDPIEVVLSDKILLAEILLYIFIIGGLIYIV